MLRTDWGAVLKTDVYFVWIAVLDPASGTRGRYTVYRIKRWTDKAAVIIGRELDLSSAKRLAEEPIADHEIEETR